MAFSYIHAFELIEAERFFRQALVEDKNCIMALWGAGLTQYVFNSGNMERGKKFLKLARALRDHKNIQLSILENELLEITDNFFASPNNEKNRLSFASEWIRLKNEFPNEIELKALAVLFTWQLDYSMKSQQETLKISTEELDQWLSEVFDKYPLHPAHHYRIHLWNDGNNEKERALESAQKNGAAFRNSAHMWHMAGYHNFASQSLWHEAIEQINIASYLDQNYQKSILEFPFTIHNYLHNQEASSNIIFRLGDFKKSTEITKGFFELPLHRTLNNPLKEHSFYEAGMDYTQRLVMYGAYQEAIEAAKKATLSAEKIRDKYALGKFYFFLAWAYTALNQESEALSYLNKIKSIKELKNYDSFYPKCYEGLRLFRLWNKDHRPEIVNKILNLGVKGNPLIVNITAYNLYRKSNAPEKLFNKLKFNYNDNLEILKKEKDIGVLLNLSWASLKLNLPLVVQEYFQEAQEISAYLDKNSDLYNLGKEIHISMGGNGDWTQKAPSGGKLAAQIPKGWDTTHHTLPIAPDFSLRNARNEKITLDKALEESPKGILLMMVLGGSCARCNEQLSAVKKFKDNFEELGYKIYAITTDYIKTMKAIQEESAKDPFAVLNFPLLSDSSFSAFKAFRNFDDFEKLPLHGTYLISKEKKLQYIHRGALPFTDFELLLDEIKRLYPSN